MRYLVLSLMIALVFSGCGSPPGDYRSAPIKSSSGKFAVFATVNRTNHGNSDYARVVLRLTDAAGKELDAYSSRAGDANKWAVGWMPDADIVVLQSSDVGSMAFRVEEGRLVELALITDEITARAKVLYAEKYGTSK